MTSAYTYLKSITDAASWSHFLALRQQEQRDHEARKRFVRFQTRRGQQGAVALAWLITHGYCDERGVWIR